ncbi:hypothetical protein POSPLADRAFT_1065949, partial [Postia placenta MAD-698-R-SB12]
MLPTRSLHHLTRDPGPGTSFCRRACQSRTPAPAPHRLRVRKPLFRCSVVPLSLSLLIAHRHAARTEQRRAATMFEAARHRYSPGSACALRMLPVPVHPYHTHMHTPQRELPHSVSNVRGVQCVRPLRAVIEHVQRLLLQMGMGIRDPIWVSNYLLCMSNE